MAFIHIPQRWVRQPHNAVGVNANSDFARGLVRVLLPPTPCDLALNTPISFGNEVKIGSDSGYACFYHPSGAGTNGIYIPTFNVANGASVLLLQRRFSTESNGWFSLGQAGNASHFPYGGLVYANPFWAARWIDGVPPQVTITQPHSFACSVKSGQQIALLDNKTIKQTSLVGTPVTEINLILLSSFLQGYTFNGALYLALFWNRALSYDELIYISKNPWQIFKPTNRVIYFPVSSGSAWTLIVANALQSHLLESVDLTQANIIALNNAAQSQSTDALDLSQISVLTVNSAQATHVVDAALLTQGQAIILNHANHNHALESIALTQAQRLALFDAAHLQSVNSIILVGDGSLAIGNSIQAQSVNQISLNQASLLSLFGAAHSQLADTPPLTQQHTINTASSAQAQTNDAVDLSTIPTLSADNTIQSQSVDALALIQAHLLAVSAALHSQAATQSVLNQETTLTTADTAHTQTASSLELTQIIVLAVLNALHDQASGLLSLATHVTLIVDDTLHTQLATAAIESAITPVGRVFMVAGENRLYLVAAAATRSFKI